MPCEINIVLIYHAFLDQFPLLVEMFHSLDIWHKAKKLTKALHQVSTCNFA